MNKATVMADPSLFLIFQNYWMPIVLIFLLGAVIAFWISAYIPGKRNITAKDADLVTVEFFPDENSRMQTRTLEQQLGRASERGIDAIFVYGQKALNLNKNIDRLDRLILPDPNSESFKYFENTVSHQMTIAKNLLEAAEKYEKKGVKVRFCPHFIFYSLMIGDRYKDTGWIHAQMVLPHSLNSERPSIETTKADHPEVIEHFAKIFDAMWEGAFPVRPAEQTSNNISI